MYICFYILTDFVFIYLLVPCKSCHYNILLTEVGVMHEAGYVDYLEHLVPLLIWILTSCPFYILWEVLLADARRFLTSRGTYIFTMHAYIFLYFNDWGG